MSKPQDGLVSRFLNRPISRWVTSRFLLERAITPNAWTISIFILPVLATILLARGDYLSIAIGAGLFQLYSTLDGCDGEIARSKNLESKWGERLDYFCDFLGSLLYVIALGWGLGYAAEGFVCAVLIAVNELFLQFVATESQAAPDETVYSRHRGMIEHSGIRIFGDKGVRWLMQFTKRDVAILFFFILALLGYAQWILHIWTVVSFASVIVSGIAAVTSNIRRSA